MRVITFQVWLGKSESFQPECERLVQLLRELGSASLEIYFHEAPGLQWILTEPLQPTYTDPPAEGRVTVFTSGTTAQPKPVTKVWANVLDGKRGSGTTQDRWLLTYSPARWAGLSVIAHCLRFSCSLVIPKSLEPKSIGKALMTCTHVSLTPSLFRMLALGNHLSPAACLRQITFGGEAVSQRVIDDARTLWPQARITHIYASSELGDVVATSDCLEGFPRLPGQLTASGELVLGGYATGDIWRIENGRFHFMGRSTEVINVGGAKVFPEQVENVLCSIPGVALARVYGASSPLVGQLVCADYVGEIEATELASRLRSLLPKHAVPRIKRVAELALSQTGKVLRS